MVQEVTCHEVSEQRIAQALDDIEGRAFNRWHRLRYDSLSLEKLQEMRDELLDHVAVRFLEDPTLGGLSRTVLRTAAECAYGVLDLGVFPKRGGRSGSRSPLPVGTSGPTGSAVAGEATDRLALTNRTASAATKPSERPTHSRGSGPQPLASTSERTSFTER